MSPATTPPTSSRRRVAVLSGLAVTIALTACASDGSTVATPAPATAAPASSTTAPATTAPATTSPATTTAPSTSAPSTSTAPSTGAVTDLLPAPDGPYAVGVTVLPEFSMHGYYPAVAGTGAGPLPYASDAMLGADGLTADDLAGIVTHADFGATPAPGDPRPMVVLAPGGGSFVDLSTALAEHLASHGYVVVTVQPDAAAESLGDQSAMLDPDAAAAISEALDEARRSQLSAAIELADDPLFEQLVGPVDATRIAVGGHSYGGSTAFDAALVDDRIAAAFDLDGALFGPAGATPLTLPSLVVMADLYGALHGDVALDDPGIADVLASTERVLSGAPATVSVGLVDATHYDVTDLPSILPAIPAELATALAGGPIGRQGTIDTQIIVQRFLDAALAETPRLPTGDELVAALPMTDPHPLPG